MPPYMRLEVTVLTAWHIFDQTPKRPYHASTCHSGGERDCSTEHDKARHVRSQSVVAAPTAPLADNKQRLWWRRGKQCLPACVRARCWVRQVVSSCRRTERLPSAPRYTQPPPGHRGTALSSGNPGYRVCPAAGAAPWRPRWPAGRVCRTWSAERPPHRPASSAYSGHTRAPRT